MRYDVLKYLSRFDQILCEMERKMLSYKMTGNITIDFISCMIPHHQAAIYMCQNLLRYTNYMPLIQIANTIITTQTRGIRQMREILKTTRGFNNSKEDIYRYFKKYKSITREMVSKMRNSARVPNINLDFTTEMIPHHEGAIAMCNNVLKYTIDPRLRVVAENIIKEQSRGVEQLISIRNHFIQR